MDKLVEEINKKVRDQLMEKIIEKFDADTSIKENMVFCEDNHLYLCKRDRIDLLGEAINVVSTQKDIDTNEYTILLEFFYKGKRNTISIPRSACLKKSELIKYQSIGMDVTERTADSVIRYIQQEEKKAPDSLVHTSLGYGTHDGKDIFKLYKGINIDSMYTGDKDIEPKGSYDKWREIINQYVIGNIPLETIMVAGFSSAVIGIVGKLIGLDSLFIHISGDSTSGKTISSMLAVSPWGNPSTKAQNGLATTWNSTQNAILSNVIGNYGLAVVFDEISMSDSLDFTQSVYRLAGGKDKQRLDKESVKKISGTWSTTIISNGEFCLLEKAKKNTGIKIRIIDFSNVPWTKDAESAEALKEGLLHNYGHAGVDFVEKLFSSSDSRSICEELKRVKDKVINNMKECSIDDKFMPRRAVKYAIIIYTAAKIKELLGLNLNCKGIMDFLIKYEKDSIQERNIEDNALQVIMNQVTINFKKFIRSNEVEPVLSEDVNNRAIEIWGKINILEDKSYNEICIVQDEFKKIMRENGFEDIRIILRKWKEEGILDTENDRYTRKRKLIQSAGPVNLYVLKIDKDKLEFSDVA